MLLQRLNFTVPPYSSWVSSAIKEKQNFERWNELIDRNNIKNRKKEFLRRKYWISELFSTWLKTLSYLFVCLFSRFFRAILLPPFVRRPIRIQWTPIVIIDFHNWDIEHFLPSCRWLGQWPEMGQLFDDQLYIFATGWYRHSSCSLLSQLWTAVRLLFRLWHVYW